MMLGIMPSSLNNLKPWANQEIHSLSFLGVETPQMLKRLKRQKPLGMKSYTIVGFSGGKCKELADHCIQIEIDDMQISEDFQCIIGHMIMQWFKLSSTS